MAAMSKRAAQLVSKLRAKSSTSRDEVVAQLVELGSEAVPPLLRALAHKDYKVRIAAAEALGKLRDPEAITALIEALSDSSKNVQEAAAEALTRVGDAAAPALLDALIGKDQAARKWAAEALGNLGDESVAMQLIARLNDPNVEVQRAAVTSLGGLMSKRAIETLIDVVASDNV
ncbi:MAG: HEAT repeat domain-containing protein [Armatimonadia bacterium]